MSKCQSVPTCAAALRRAYRLMRARFGHQHWWPGETPFEVCVGAILTQNTAWTNVERAIANLKAAGVLEPQKLFAVPVRRLAALIRPAGYYNVKARRLRAFLQVLVRDFGGDLARMLAGETAAVRARLLAIPGIGPETADSMLLYAGGHLSFVIDAYTRRIFQRHGWSGNPPPPAARITRPATSRATRPGQQPAEDGFSYSALQALCEQALRHRPAAATLDYWQDYHAQLVQVGKHFCRPRAPRCEACPLRSLLPA